MKNWISQVNQLIRCPIHKWHTQRHFVRLQPFSKGLSKDKRVYVLLETINFSSNDSTMNRVCMFYKKSKRKVPLIKFEAFSCQILSGVFDLFPQFGGGLGAIVKSSNSMDQNRQNDSGNQCSQNERPD